MPSGRRWSLGLRSASTAEWSGCRGLCFSGCSRSDPARAVRRGLLSPADQVRVHRRTEAAPAPVDRGRECRGQRAGFCGKAALRRRSTPDRRDNDRRPYRRPRAYLNRHPPSSRRRRVFPGTPRARWRFRCDYLSYGGSVAASLSDLGLGAAGAGASGDLCVGKHAKRSRRIPPGGICNVTALLLCRPTPLLSASMRTAVTPGGTSYCWTTSHSICIRASSPGQISIKHAPDDGGQEDYRGGKQQSGDYLSPQSSGASSSRPTGLTARIEFGGPHFHRMA